MRQDGQDEPVLRDPAIQVPMFETKPPTRTTDSCAERTTRTAGQTLGRRRAHRSNTLFSSSVASFNSSLSSSVSPASFALHPVVAGPADLVERRPPGRVRESSFERPSAGCPRWPPGLARSGNRRSWTWTSADSLGVGEFARRPCSVLERRQGADEVRASSPPDSKRTRRLTRWHANADFVSRGLWCCRRMILSLTH